MGRTAFTGLSNGVGRPGDPWQWSQSVTRKPRSQHTEEASVCFEGCVLAGELGEGRVGEDQRSAGTGQGGESGGRSRV
eukprot:365452-Chlamydomonas_euryale.AAC.21